MGVFDMGIRERIAIRGRYRVWERPKGSRSGAWLFHGETTNKILNEGLGMIAYALIDYAAKYDTGLTYQCIGTDNTPPVATDSGLNAEVKRKTFSSKTYDTGVMEITLSTFFAASECTYNIKEVGLAGTSDATASLDTGVYMNHALYSYDNSAGDYDLTFECILELAEKTI